MSTANGTKGSAQGRLLPAAVRCPGGEHPGDGIGNAPPPNRLVNRTDSRERAVLMRAFTNSSTDLTAEQARLGAACTAVVRSALRVERGIGALERFRRIEAGRRAPRTAAPARPPEHGEQATAIPRARRAALMWRLLLWPVTIASAVFDSAFIASIVQQLLNVRSDSVHYWLAYLPGIGIAVCLLAAGSFLAEQLQDLQEAREATGAPRRPPHSVRKWLWQLKSSLLFVAAVLSLTVMCGVVRVSMAVEESGEPVLERYQWVMIALLLFLAVSSVTAKVLSHNPAPAETATDGASAKDLKKRCRTADNLAAKARKAMARHVTAWFALKAAVDGAEQRARKRVEDASAGLVEERARTGTAGSFEFPLESPAWPVEQQPTIACAAAAVTPLRRTGEPQIRIDLLDEAGKILKDHRHDHLSRRLHEVLADLDRLWGPDESPPASQDPLADAAVDARGSENRQPKERTE
ncbi:hypothetical protein L1I79_31215 [Strepomyces sp. STD 3.1]|uniref:hypothetical protein n=1 Tax=Streptomyces sp. NPDC058985 TaxID=3346684 RepID=UPI001F2C43EF|nr:hypothetical protein [Streptomyces sp. STD 3.1]